MIGHEYRDKYLHCECILLQCAIVSSKSEEIVTNRFTWFAFLILFWCHQTMNNRFTGDIIYVVLFRRNCSYYCCPCNAKRNLRTYVVLGVLSLYLTLFRTFDQIYIFKSRWNVKVACNFTMCFTNGRKL